MRRLERDSILGFNTADNHDNQKIIILAMDGVTGAFILRQVD
jgi:hypothetical protein